MVGWEEASGKVLSAEDNSMPFILIEIPNELTASLGITFEDLSRHKT